MPFSKNKVTDFPSCKLCQIFTYDVHGGGVVLFNTEQVFKKNSLKSSTTTEREEFAIKCQIPSISPRWTVSLMSDRCVTREYN